VSPTWGLQGRWIPRKTRSSSWRRPGISKSDQHVVSLPLLSSTVLGISPFSFFAKPPNVCESTLQLFTLTFILFQLLERQEQPPSTRNGLTCLTMYYIVLHKSQRRKYQSHTRGQLMSSSQVSSCQRYHVVSFECYLLVEAPKASSKHQADLVEAISRHHQLLFIFQHNQSNLCIPGYKNML